jgi:hypothetical protein
LVDVKALERNLKPLGPSRINVRMTYERLKLKRNNTTHPSLPEMAQPQFDDSRLLRDQQVESRRAEKEVRELCAVF